MADIKNTVVTEFIAKTGKAVKSVDKLADAQKKQQKQTKDASASIKKEMGGALQGLQGNLTAATGGLGAMISSVGRVIKSLKLLKISLISTGIGAIVVAVGALFAAFTKTQAGGDKLSQAMAGLGAIMDELLGRAGKLGSALFKLIQLDFSGAMEDAKAAVDGFGEAIVGAASAAASLVKDRQEFRDTERAINKEIAENAAKVQDLLFITRDSNATLLEQKQALADAAVLEVENEEARNELAQKRVDFAQQELDNAPEGLENQQLLNDLNQAEIDLLNAQAGSRAKQREILNRQKELETRILADQKAQNDALREQEEIRVKAEEERLKRLEKQQEEIDEESEAAAERNTAALNALTEFEFAQEEIKAEAIDNAADRADALTKVENDRFVREINLAKGNATKIELIEKKHAVALVKINKDTQVQIVKDRETATAATATMAAGLASGISGLLKEGSAEAKVAALAEIAFSTAAGIANATKAGAGLVWPANLAAIVSGIGAVLAGIVSAKAALSQAPPEATLARGGMLRGPSHRRGGIRIEAEGGEAVINKRSMANPGLRRMASRINQAGGGIAFAQDGLLAGQANTAAGLRGLPGDIEKAMMNAPPVLVTEDFNIVNNRVKVTEETATL